MSKNKKPTSKQQKLAPSVEKSISLLWHEAVIADYAHLRSFPGVRSVSIGSKEIGGKVTGRLCVKIYVERKLEASAVTYRLPKSTTVLFPTGSGFYKERRVRTDIVEAPGIRLIASPTSRLNPLPVGAQIGFPLGAGGAGTLGCWVVKAGSSLPTLLTAGHVVSSGQGAVQAGQAVYQPQPPFPSPQFDPLIIGQTVEGFVGNDMEADGYLDYAAISLAPGGRGITNASPEPCVVSRPAHLSVEEILAEQTEVRKYGAQTRCTDGVFSVFHAHFTDTGGATFNNILEFSSGSLGQNIGDSGDSGSLVVSRSPATAGAAVGLLFGVAANDNTRGFVVPFERLAKFGFRMA